MKAKAAQVKLLLFDVDGVLTDGKVVVHSDGSESKAFAIRDGIALVWAQRAGLRVGILSARHSPTTQHRAAQLGITLIHQGVANKLDAYEAILSEQGMSDSEVAYMGDDVVDLAVLARVGFATAPADAVPEVRSAVHWVSAVAGGNGAVREMVELVLRAQERWEPIVAAYRGEGGQRA